MKKDRHIHLHATKVREIAEPINIPCLKCTKSFKTWILKIYYEDKLMKRSIGHRICSSCRMANRRIVLPLSKIHFDLEKIDKDKKRKKRRQE